MGKLHPGRDPSPPASTSPDSARIAGSGEGRGPGPYVMSCETLAGDEVVNPRGERLGTLAHVMIEVPSGRIAYAVLARGGVLGLGERLHALPWSALTLDADRHRFILDVEVERLERAPGFDRDHWPGNADLAWVRDAASFYEGNRPAERGRGMP